jgi:hypothetical protein
MAIIMAFFFKVYKNFSFCDGNGFLCLQITGFLFGFETDGTNIKILRIRAV